MPNLGQTLQKVYKSKLFNILNNCLKIISFSFRLQSVSAMESALSGSIPHRHLSTSGSHYSDKRQRPFPTYTLIDKSPRSQSRSTCSTSPRSLNSLDLSSQRADLNRHRVGSESQKLKRDNPFVSHQRQWSMEAPRSLNSIIHRPSPVPYLTKPSHLSHEQLKRTEPMFLFNRDNSLRSSSGSVVSQRRSVYQPRSSPSGSVATGTLPIETPTPDPSLASSVFETNRNKLSSTSTKTIVPKYSDSKAKGTPVRTARTEITPRNDSEMDDGTSPYKHYIHPSEFNHFLDQVSILWSKVRAYTNFARSKYLFSQTVLSIPVHSSNDGTTAVLDKFGGLIAIAAKYFPLATTKFQC